MILFVAPNPFKVKARDGFLQRVAAIDGLFENEEKVYLEDVSSLQEQIRTLAKARMIYVHSIYQAEKIIDSYPLLSPKIITDMHGVVPEEIRFAGNVKDSRRLAEIEKKVFEHGRYFVGVTHAMVDHFTKKYKLPQNIHWIVMPIFDRSATKVDYSAKRQEVIYAGGSQPWQNVEKMIEAINSTYQQYTFKILTPDAGSFRDISAKAQQKSTLMSVPSSKVASYYKQASLGFILRGKMTINTVACPTKMIEYLEYGVVPIVLSANIGDFKRLGYAYITYEDFLQRNFSLEELHKLAKQNEEVVTRLHGLTVRGESELRSLYDQLKKPKREERDLLSAKVETAMLAQKLRDQDQEIARQRHVIEQQQQSIAQLNETIWRITASKSWKMIRAIRKALPSRQNPRNK